MQQTTQYILGGLIVAALLTVSIIALFNRFGPQKQKQQEASAETSETGTGASESDTSGGASFPEMALELYQYLGVNAMAGHRDECVFGSMKDHDGDKFCTKENFTINHGGIPSSEYDTKKEALAACKNDPDCVLVSKMVNSEKYGTFRHPATVWKLKKDYYKENFPDMEFKPNMLGLNESEYKIGPRNDKVESSIIMMPNFKSGMAMAVLRYKGKKSGEFYVPIWNETALTKMKEKSFKHTTHI